MSPNNKTKLNDCDKNNQTGNDKCTSFEKSPSEVIKRFRSLIEEHLNLRDYSFDEDFLLKFLRCRNFNLNRSLEVLEGYLNKLTDRPDLFTWEPESTRKVLDTSVFTYFVDESTSDEQIFFLHPGRWNPKEVNIESIISMVIMCQEIALLSEQVQRSGIVVIIDMTGLTLTHLYKCGISNAKLISELTDHCLPSNIINIHVVFQNWLTEMGYNLFKPFLDEELKRRIVFHGYDIGSVHKYCSLSKLPEKYGGTHSEPNLDEIFQTLTDGNCKVQDIWNKYKIKLI